MTVLVPCSTLHHEMSSAQQAEYRDFLNEGTSTTDFLYDRLGGLPQVVDDGTKAYLHDVTGNSASIDGTTDDATYPLADALGSTRLVTDSEGAALGDTTWDVWGNEQNTTGTQYAFGWTGQPYDASGDLVHLRAPTHRGGLKSCAGTRFSPTPRVRVRLPVVQDGVGGMVPVHAVDAAAGRGGG